MKRVVRASRHVLAIVLAGTITGCATRGSLGNPADCEPVEDPAGQAIEGAALAGEYRLTLVATEGERSGTTAEGTLTLRQNPPDRRGLRGPGGEDRRDASVPLYGWTDVDPRSVGAVDLGDPGSQDIEMPGVLAIDNGGLRLRIGAEGNRRDMIRFDGGYTVLRVERADDDGFRGSWTSGAVDVVAEGYFCAERAG